MWEHRVFLAMLFLAICCSCQHQVPNISIHGIVTAGPGIKVVLQEIDTREVLSVDSVHANAKGYFFFKHHLKEAGFFRLILPNQKNVLLVILPGDLIRLTTDTISGFRSSTNIQGSDESEWLLEFMTHADKNRFRVDSIEQLIIDHRDSSDFAELTMASISSFQSILDDQLKLEKEFLATHSSALASLIVINFGFGPKPVLTMEDHLPLFLRLDSALAISYPKNKHLIYHHKRIIAFQDRLLVKNK